MCLMGITDKIKHGIPSSGNGPSTLDRDISRTDNGV